MEILREFLHSAFAIPLVAITSGCLVVICTSVAKQWRRVRQAEIDAALKHKMLEQGMSADDIQKVLDAGAVKSGCGNKITF
jgi:hypothetical protein